MGPGCPRNDRGTSINQKSTILFLDHAPITGGAEKSLLMVMQNLASTGYSVHLAAPAGDYADIARTEQISVHELNFPRLRRSLNAPMKLFSVANQVARIGREVRADMLYANTVRTAFFAALTARLSRLPLTWHMRDFWLAETAQQIGLGDAIGKRFLCRSAKLVLANSYAVRNHLPCAGAVHVVHNGIDLEFFKAAPDPDVFRRKYGIPDNAPLIGMVGRLRPWKGPDRFLRIMAKVSEHTPEAHFLVVGGTPFGVDDPFAEGLAGMAADLGIAGRVTFTGHLQDIRPALAAMDIFVHPGDPEPFGLVNIEAMAMEKPVVAFNHGALPEIVIPGKTGSLVTPDDERQMAEAVQNLLESPEKMREMGLAGRRRVAEKFTIQHTVSQIQELLSRIDHR